MAQLARLSIDRCCPWGTARDRRYGHAEVTAGEDDAGSGRAATVSSLTGGEARRLGHTYVGAEHLLLVLIRDRNGGATAVLRQLGVSTDADKEALWPCVAAGLPRIDPDALATLGIDFEAVRERLEEKFGPGALEHTRSGCLGVTPPTKQARAHALDHADGQPLGDERILLSMLPFPTRSPPRSSQAGPLPARGRGDRHAPR